MTAQPEGGSGLDGPLTCVTTYGPGAGSARVRLYEWLRRVDVAAEVHQYLGSSAFRASDVVRHPLSAGRAEAQLRDLANRGAERLFMQREASPFSTGRLEHLLLTSAEHSVFDLDDALQVDWGGSSPARRVFPKAAKVVECLRDADVVIAGSEALADFASGLSRTIVTIPSCVDPLDYDRKRDYGLSDPPVIGWLGSPSQEVELLHIAGPLRELNRRYRVRLRVISAPGPVLSPFSGFFERVAWSPEVVRREVATWDIGIMPLRDGLWQRGKCAYKLLQYGAAGVPAVGSPVGANRRVLAASGCLAPVTEDEWLDSLVELLDRSALQREEYAASLHRTVVADYSYSTWLSTWEDTVVGSARSTTAPAARNASPLGRAGCSDG